MRQPTSSIDVPVATPNRPVQFSLRGLLMAVAGVACVLSGFSMHGVFGASSVTLALGLLLVVRGRQTKTRWITCAGLGLVFPSLLILGVMQVFGIGPIFSRGSWPDECRRMAEIGGADRADSKVVGLGGFLDSAHAWRLSLDPVGLDAIAAKFELHPLPAGNAPSSFWEAFPRWWRPSHEQDCRYLSTLDFPAQSRGEDGYHYFAMYDPRNEWLYVWHKFNF